MSGQPVQALQVIVGGETVVEAAAKLSVALVAYLAI
jgi:hypothetical protein